MEGDHFTPPIVRIAEKFVKWREREVTPKAERSSRFDPDTAQALAHVAAALAATSGFGSEAYYYLQHPQIPNEQDEHK